MNRGAVVRVLRGAVVVVATVGVTQQITSRTPQQEDYEAPFPIDSGLGEPVRLRDVELTVLDVEGGRSVVDAAGTSRSSAGVWVVAHVRIEVLREPLVPGRFQLADAAGRVYDRTTRVEAGLEMLQQPGVPVTSAVAFEVPGDLDGDLEVRLDHDRFDVRGDARADVHVAVDDATWVRWRATDLVSLPEREIGG